MSWTEDHTIGGRVTVRDVLYDSEKRLGAVGVPSPGVDAAEIVAFVLQTRRSRLFLSDDMSSEQRVRVEQMLAKRLSRVPLQHLTGTAPFRRIEVAVGPGVFIPRPETELATEAAVRELAALPEADRTAVDLCTGSGAIALSLGLEVAGGRVWGVELSPDAWAWAQRNLAAQEGDIAAHGSTVQIIEDDCALVAEPGHALADQAGRIAVVIANPPYIPDMMIPREPEVRDHEPGLALYGGPDGLHVVRSVLRTAAVLLRPGGLLVMEHADVQGPDAGTAGVPGAVAAFTADDLPAAGVAKGGAVFTSVVDRIDLNGLPRFTLARKVQG